jgi:hypothetical protein
MKWTTEKPIVPGWYWFRIDSAWDGPIWKPAIYHTRELEKFSFPISDHYAQYSGPIDEPEDTE